MFVLGWQLIPRTIEHQTVNVLGNHLSQMSIYPQSKRIRSVGSTDENGNVFDDDWYVHILFIHSSIHFSIHSSIHFSMLPVYPALSAVSAIDLECLSKM